MAIDVSVKEFGGGSYNMKVDVDKTTVRGLKNMLSNSTSIPVDDQILVYNGVTLLDTQSLRECGIDGNKYKVILGSKTQPLSVERRDIPMMPERNTFISRINVRFKYDYKDFYSTEDISRMSYVMWKTLHKMSEDISFDHLEKVAAKAWKVHEEVLTEVRDNYYKTFLENHWKIVESRQTESKRDGLVTSTEH